MQAPAAISRHRRELEQYARKLVSSQQPPVLYRMIRYHLGWEDLEGNASESTSKALRPALCMLACEAMGGDSRRAIPAAAAIELVHNFSLIHDDIQDQDRERRNRPTVWSVWGEAQAINAGDALLALARLALLHLRDERVSVAVVLEAAAILDARTLEMVEGQTMDLSFEETLEVPVDSYLEMIDKKTGALFDCSLRLGTLIAGANEDCVQAMGRCGRRIGTAFQIRDDMLGIWGDQRRTGKQPAADIRRRKKSLPVVHALTRAAGAMLDDLRRVYTNKSLSEDDVAVVLSALDSTNARAYCESLARENEIEALTQLDRLALGSAAAQELRDTATFLLERDF